MDACVLSQGCTDINVEHWSMWSIGFTMKQIGLLEDFPHVAVQLVY